MKTLSRNIRGGTWTKLPFTIRNYASIYHMLFFTIDMWNTIIPVRNFYLLPNPNNEIIKDYPPNQNI